jgi:hypothetical protein
VEEAAKSFLVLLAKADALVSVEGGVIRGVEKDEVASRKVSARILKITAHYQGILQSGRTIGEVVFIIKDDVRFPTKGSVELASLIFAIQPIEATLVDENEACGILDRQVGLEIS